MNTIESVAGISLITPERLENLARAVSSTLNLRGDMAELGVYRGGSARVVSAVCPNKTLHLFDTFSGLPYEESASRNPGRLIQQGQFSCSQSDVEEFLSGYNVTFHAGVFPGSAESLTGMSFSFVHVDCDLYQSAADAIDFFWPRMTTGGIMFFDDYGCDFTGVTDAVNEAFSKDQIIQQIERSNQIKIGCLVVKD